MDQTGPVSLRPEIRRVLDELRGRVRRYVLIEGTAAVIAILCLLFWLSFSLDAVHFEVRKLELPGWLRTGFSLIGVCVLAAAAGVWIMSRVLRSFRARALALVLEKRFPQLGDRLITAVELSGAHDARHTELGGAMLQHTIADAASQVRGLNLRDVFDPAPLRRWLIGAGVLVVSVAGFGALNAQAMERWFNAFVLLRDDYWEPYRRSAMTVKVLVQPGDRLKEFDAHGEYKHPRGADLTLLAEVPEGRVVPEDVTLYYRTFGGAGDNRGNVAMSRMSERSFRHTLGRVIDPHNLWVMGGDFVNPHPYRVLIVDPPRIDQIVLRCDYPDYTGMDAFSDKDQVVQGTQISLPVETSFELRANTNKKLVSVQIRCEHFDLKFGLERNDGELVDTPTTLTIQSPDESGAPPRGVELPSGLGRQWVSADRQSFVVPMILATKATETLASLTAAEFRHIPLPPDTQVQIYLADDDDIFSPEPALLSINGILDREPVVETQRRGVGPSITRMAEIPIEGRVNDDYGVSSAWFGYRIDDDAEFSQRPLAKPPRGEKDFNLGVSEGARIERFNVLPLEMQVEQKLALTVLAEDGDNLNGPHVSHGEVYAFTIVTPEELLAQLYDKELNLRQRYEQIRREVAEVRDDLVLHQQRYAEGRQLRDQPPPEAARADWEEQLRQIGVAVAACAERSLHLVRKTHTESRSVEAGFRGIREEMVNNRVDTATALRRIEEGVLHPLHDINETDYPVVDERIGLFRLANERQADPTAAIDEAVSAIEQMLIRMDRVLAQMSQRKDINQMIKDLQAILDGQQKLKDETQQEQQRRFFDLIK